MLDASRHAPRLLGDSAELVVDFIYRCQGADGGFLDRAGRSDLYYTPFALDGLAAMGRDLPHGSVEDYLKGFGGGELVDFVHRCCLARCWAALGRPDACGMRDRILRGIESHRTADGGYDTGHGVVSGSAYGCFLAVGAYQDLGREPPDEPGLPRCIQTLMSPTGACSNAPRLSGDAKGKPAQEGSTLATAAAVAVLREVCGRGPGCVAWPKYFNAERTVSWLFAQAHPRGGFRAAPAAPLPDLLSTATALHALAGLGVSFNHARESLLDFLDSLWTNAGGFHGHWADESVDLEYTFYGLLALGHLARS